MGVFIMVALIGLVRSWLLVPQPLVIIEDVKIEKFASAYGISAIISGLVTIIIGGLVGKMRKEKCRYIIIQGTMIITRMSQNSEIKVDNLFFYDYIFDIECNRNYKTHMKILGFSIHSKNCCVMLFMLC